MFVGLVLWLSSQVLAAETLPSGQIIERVTCQENPAKSYALYVPSTYQPQRPAPLLLLFEPASRGALPLRFFKHAAETWGFIVACSYDTPNYTPWEENRVGIQATWNDVLQRFRVDSRRMYVGGLSGGARLASRVAFVTDGVAGVVSCGAGFWMRDSNAPAPEFEVVSTVGTTDFNYLELYDLEKELKKRRLPHRRILFDGGHLWPGSEDCYEILAWLQNRAWRNGLISPEAVRAAEQLKIRSEAAESMEQKGHVFLAASRYRQIIEDLDGLIDTESLKNRLKDLERGDAYKKAQKQERRARQWERSQQRKLVRRLKSGEYKAENNPMGLNMEYGFWKNQGKILIKQAEDKTLIFEARAAQRMLSLLRANIYESSVYQIREKAYKKVLFINKVGGELSPRSPSPPYNRAIAYAGMGELEKALEDLELAIKRGFKDTDRIRADKDMAILKEDPGFEALLQRYQGKDIPK